MDKQQINISLGDEVALRMSGEPGIVIGIAQYLESVPDVLVRYKASDHRQVEAWWSINAVLLVRQATLEQQTPEAE